MLPEKHADTIRDLGEPGGGRGGDIHLHVHAADGASVKRMLIDNKAHWPRCYAGSCGAGTSGQHESNPLNMAILRAAPGRAVYRVMESFVRVMPNGWPSNRWPRA